MTEETSANQANFDEVRPLSASGLAVDCVKIAGACRGERTDAFCAKVESHLKLLNTRLKNMMPDSNSAQSKLLDDYEDYYDRSISLRVMENNTLRTQLEEKVQAVSQIGARHTRSVRIAWALVATVVVLLLEIAAPGATLAYAASLSFTTGDVMSHAAGMLLVWWMCR